MKQINADAKTTNISANFITNDHESRLILGSTTTGAGSEIMTTSRIPGFSIGTTDQLDPASATSAGYIGSPPSDASFTINGFAITSKSNNIDKTVGGLPMNLMPGSENSTTTVTVSTDKDGLKALLQTLIDAYNAVVSAVATVTKATISDTPEPKTGPVSPRLT